MHLVCLSFSGFQECLDDAAVFRFHLQKARKRRLETEVFCVGGVDTAYHRLRDALKRLIAEPAPHEIGDRFVCNIAAAGNEGLHSHSEFASPTENGALKEREKRARCHHVKTFGDRMQCAVSDDKTTTHVWIRADEGIGDAEFFAQGLRPRFSCNEGIRSVLNHEPIAMRGVDDTADPGARLK